MKKIWKEHPEQCDLCGDDSEIFTDEDMSEGYGYDGDDLRCVSCGCKGTWSVSDDGSFCNWDHDTGTSD